MSGVPDAPVVSALAAIVEERLAGVRARIATAGGGREVRIVAVTKGFGADVVAATVDAGLLDLGENYAQELLTKAADAPPAVRWHFLGPLQTNKAARLAPVVAVLARRRPARRRRRHRPAPARARRCSWRSTSLAIRPDPVAGRRMLPHWSITSGLGSSMYVV